MGKKQGMVRSKKQTQGHKVVHCHAQGYGLLFFVLLKNKEKTLHYKWDVCDALMTSRP